MFEGDNVYMLTIVYVASTSKYGRENWSVHIRTEITIVGPGLQMFSLQLCCVL